MGWRRQLEKLAWRLAGFPPPHRVYPTSRIKVSANPVEIKFRPGDRLLVLSPHPDDEVIGCGGLLAQALEQQAEVWVLYLTDGERGGDPQQRRTEIRAVQDFCHRRFGRTFTAYSAAQRELHFQAAAIQDEVRGLCQQIRPHFLFLPHQGDNHRDHRDANLALSPLVKELRQRYQVKLFGYEIWSPLQMDAFVDISDLEADKRQLIQLYQSQRRDKDYADLILSLNRYRAACLPGPVRLAEALELIGGD